MVRTRSAPERESPGTPRNIESPIRLINKGISRGQIRPVTSKSRYPLPSEGRGHRFESCRARQSFQLWDFTESDSNFVRMIQPPPTNRLRIWGSGVRIAPGAPILSANTSAYVIFERARHGLWKPCRHRVATGPGKSARWTEPYSPPARSCWRWPMPRSKASILATSSGDRFDAP